jgi:hypothetical protein
MEHPCGVAFTIKPIEAHQAGHDQRQHAGYRSGCRTTAVLGMDADKW